jgi:hypothetical protein
MIPPESSRAVRIVVQLKRRTLAASAGTAIAFLILAAIIKPTSRGGAILLGLSTSILASIIVAAIALEKNEFAETVSRLGIRTIFGNRKREVPDDWWTELLRDSRRHFRVLGTANHGYLQNSDVVRQETKSALETALNRDGVQIVFLWLDPELETAKQREQEEARRTLRSDTCDAIKFFWEFRKGLNPDKAERLKLRVYKALPTCGITWADDDIIVTHYLTGELNLTAPGLILQATRGGLRQLLGHVLDQRSKPPPLSALYMKNYEEVASDHWSTEVTDQHVAKLAAFRDSLADQAGKQSEAELRHVVEPGDNPS